MSRAEEKPFVSKELDNRCFAQMPTFFCLRTVQPNDSAFVLERREPQQRGIQGRKQPGDNLYQTDTTAETKDQQQHTGH